jgi:hypothetical protein
MIKHVIFAAALGSTALSTTAYAQTSATEKMSIDPTRLKLAEEVAAKLLPEGVYQKMMQDMAKGDLMQQIMGMDAASIVKAAGVDTDGAAGAEGLEGKSMADIASEKDPHFKERMDIMMKVMFEEMGPLMGKIEPEARAALAKIYARKYDAKQLTDMNMFFGTPSGSSFARDFMGTFTDKEMIDASMKMIPVMLEALPDIMKKVEAATAHLPPMPKSEEEMAATADPYANETGEEPWYDDTNWTPAQKKQADALMAKYEGLEAKTDAASEKSTAALAEWETAYNAAVGASRDKFKAQGWTAPAPTAEPTESSE